MAYQRIRDEDDFLHMNYVHDFLEGIEDEKREQFRRVVKADIALGVTALALGSAARKFGARKRRK